MASTLHAVILSNLYVQAFPYFYVPYDNDFPTDPVQGAEYCLFPNDTTLQCLAGVCLP